MYTSSSLKKRIIALSLLILFCAFGLIGRLYFIQIKQGKNLQSKALDQWLRDLPLGALRGSITDRNGVTLAESVTVYDIYVKPVLVENVDAEATIYANVLELEEDKTKLKIADRKLSEVLLCKNVTKEKVDELFSRGLNSFVATENSSRNYLYPDLLSQILGFTSVDGEGQSGLEQFYNTYLKGVKGIALEDADARGSGLTGGKSYYVPAIDGLNLELTIDFRVQSALEEILQRAKETTGAKSTSALVMNPNTGEILGVTTKPSPNLDNIDRDNLTELFKMYRSFTITDTYEPGSTFKTITAAIGLDCGVTSLGHGYYCPGYRMVDGVRTNCHRKSGHGPQTLVSGFYNSCNCVFMQLISDIGIDRYFEYVKKFHFDSYLGIDYPSEATAIIIDKDQMMTNDFLRNGFGQSIAVSALQLTSAISATVTDGYLKKPYLVKKMYANDGKVVYEQTLTQLEKVVSENIVNDMRELMRMVVKKGGGGASKVEGYTVGGKTGTAQKYDATGVSTTNYIGSYICISPVENPKYVVMVIIDEPKTSIYGNIVATPVAGEILKKLFEIYGDKPYVDVDAAEQIEVPNLIGKSYTEACSLLAGLGFYYVTEGEGSLVSFQYPSAGTKLEKGQSILLKF